MDSAKNRYYNLHDHALERQTNLDDALPLATHFKVAHENLLEWMQEIEPELRGKEPVGPEAEYEIQVCRWPSSLRKVYCTCLTTSPFMLNWMKIQSLDVLLALNFVVQQKLQESLDHVRPILEGLNEQGTQLANLSPGDGAAKITDMLTRDNRNFDNLANQVQKRADKINLKRQKSLEVKFNS